MKCNCDWLVLKTGMVTGKHPKIRYFQNAAEGLIKCTLKMSKDSYGQNPLISGFVTRIMTDAHLRP